ncbi:MAG: SPFH domain-containing protein [Thermoprotei archaeon]|nr:SPFH domain-containing protein [TACK group archaeon]
MVFLQALAISASMIAAVVVLIFVLIFLAYSIRIVKEYERLVVFRFGRVIGEKGPGIVFIIPIIDVPKKVDLRERYITVPHQTCITKDNAPVDIDFLIYTKVFNATDSVVQVQNFEGAATGIATTTLRAVIGDIQLDEILAKRDTINQILRSKLDEVTARWGVKVSSVEIREIIPPKDVQDAMIKQMSAERSRRAMVIEADGKKTAAVTVAEGDKQSEILRAEGDKQAAILRAEGLATALKTISGTAKDVDQKTMSLQYFEVLKQIGSSPSTKYVLPMEFVAALKPVTDFLKSFSGEQEAGDSEASERK